MWLCKHRKVRKQLSWLRSLFFLVLGIELRSSSLAGTTFIHWTIFLTTNSFPNSLLKSVPTWWSRQDTSHTVFYRVSFCFICPPYQVCPQPLIVQSPQKLDDKVILLIPCIRNRFSLYCIMFDSLYLNGRLVTVLFLCSLCT